MNTQLLRVFDWLLWTTIQGSVLIILILLIQLILRRRLPVRWHYLLWGLLLIRLAVPWLPESKWSVFNLVPRSVQQGRIIETFAQPKVTRGMGFHMYAEPAEMEQAETATVKFARALPAIWLAGTVLIAVYVCFRNIRLWRTVKRERPITSSEILDLLEDCKMQMGVETIIGVVVSDRIKSPALFGFVRPRLLLPQGMLETYGHEELRYVFIHELAHLKQRDIYLGWLMALLHIAHWFNPLMWFAFGRMRADRELACDNLAISKMDADEPPRYGRTIVSLLESFSQVGYLPSVAGILEDTCQIERRIKMIADYKKTSRKRWAGAMLLLAALAFIVLTNAYVAKADFIFSTPTSLGPIVNSSASDGTPSISADGLELYFLSLRPGGLGYGDIWVTKRATKDDNWGTPVNLGPPVNSSYWELCPYISRDGLMLYFASLRPGGYGGDDLYVATRATKEDDWSNAVNLGPVVNSSEYDWGQCVSADGLELYFGSIRPGGHGELDLWVTTRETRNDDWSEPVNLGPTVNSSASEGYPIISTDGLTLFFSDHPVGGTPRLGGYGGTDIWVTTRATRSEPWDKPVNLGPAINSSSNEDAPSISAGGSVLYFSSGQPGAMGTWDLWQVSILPIVDFNADGIVDCVDMCMMMDHWDTNEPLYDIAPVPFGDGIVDVQDLIVLTEHLTKNQAEPNAVTP